MDKIIEFSFRYIPKQLYIYYLFLCGFTSIAEILSPFIMGEVINLLTEQNRIEKVGKMIGIYFLFNLFHQGIAIIQNYSGIKLEADSEYAANRQFLKRLYHTSYLNVGMEDPAKLNQKLSNDLNCVIGFVIAFFRDIINKIIFIICIAVILVSQSTVLCLILFTLALFYALVYLFTKKKIYDVSYNLKQSQTSFFGHLYSMVYFLKSIRINGFENVSFQRLDEEYKKYFVALHCQVSVNTIFNTTINLISLFAQTMLFLIGGKMVLDRRLSIGLLVVIMNYFSILLQTTDYFLNLGQSYQNTLSSYDRLLPYDNMEQIDNGVREIDTVEIIELSAIEFAYAGQKPLFQISQKFEKGNIYWLKGKNGIGKSSLLNVILGLFGYDYTGAMEINHIPFSEIDCDKMISQTVAIVEQEPYLLSDTLRNNMLCKSRDMDLKETNQELKRLLTLFGMDDFVKKQPQGLNTIYCSMNSSMSGGEKQKIAIIRLLLSSADVWFLDEPTSSLDIISTKHFYEELDRCKSNHIIVIISHEIPSKYDYMVEMENYV